MASKQTYPCFQCRKAGHEVMVFLDGKDEQGRTKYLNEDGARHTHVGSSHSSQQQRQQRQQQQVQPTIADILVQIKLLSQKVDKLLEASNDFEQ
jgi:hypothetical protein